VNSASWSAWSVLSWKGMNLWVRVGNVGNVGNVGMVAMLPGCLVVSIFIGNSHMLTGSIPTELGKLTNLTYLSCRSNKLAGTAVLCIQPGSSGSFGSPSLFCSDNLYLPTGTLPMELGNCIKLTRFSYDWYNFSSKLSTRLFCNDVCCHHCADRC